MSEISETQRTGGKYITVAYYLILSREYPDDEETKKLERQIANDPECLEIMREWAKKKRKRGPSLDTLNRCEEAMRYWLDEDKDLQTAVDLVFIHRQTVERWIPEILTRVDQDTKERWQPILKSLCKIP